MTQTTPAPLDAPLTPAQIRARLDDHGTVTGTVSALLSEAIDGDLESWLDSLGEALVGSSLLMDISYKVVGHGPDGDTLLLEVTGDPSMVLDTADEDDEGQT